MGFAGTGECKELPEANLPLNVKCPQAGRLQLVLSMCATVQSNLAGKTERCYFNAGIPTSAEVRWNDPGQGKDWHAYYYFNGAPTWADGHGLQHVLYVH